MKTSSNSWKVWEKNNLEKSNFKQRENRSTRCFLVLIERLLFSNFLLPIMKWQLSICQSDNATRTKLLIILWILLEIYTFVVLEQDFFAWKGESHFGLLNVRINFQKNWIILLKHNVFLYLGGSLRSAKCVHRFFQWLEQAWIFWIYYDQFALRL